MKIIYAPTLYLIRGLPGSGKSTFANQLLNAGIVQAVYSADDYFYKDGVYNFDASKLGTAHLQCLNKTCIALDLGANVAVANTFTTENEMNAYLRHAELTGVNVVSLIVENRHGNSSVHNVPEETLNRMRSRFSVKL